MLAWASSMAWKGIHPIVKLNEKIYSRVALTKVAMREVEKRLQRNPELPKWDILIRLLMGKFIPRNLLRVVRMLNHVVVSV
jgi:hypothetical protein